MHRFYPIAPLKACVTSASRICVGLALLLLTLAPASHADPSPPPPYFGTNPSVSDIRASLVHWGQVYQVPPHILFAIAWQEGNPYPYNKGWLQYDPNDSGRTVYHLEQDGRVGVGIMQITVLPSDSNYKRLCIDYDYNIQRGAAYLADAANSRSCWRNSPIIGDNDRTKLENWFYAIWTYNGLDATITSRAYPDKILSWIRSCPNGQWDNVNVTAPTVAQTDGHHTIPATPSPYHVDANFDGVIDGTTGGGVSDPTNIYVSLSGNDASNGTSGAPVRTIKYAIDQASTTQPVTIYIAPGSYGEKISTTKHIHFVTNGSGTVQTGG